MSRNLRLRRLALSLAVLAAVLGTAVGTATATSYYPLLVVSGDAPRLGQVNDLVFGVEYLSSAGQASSVSIQTPAGFSGSFVQGVGTKLGTAQLGVLPAGTNVSATSKPSYVRYTGSLLVMDPAAFASDPAAQACAPGPHRAVWQLTLANVAHGNLTLPVAVDASHGGYKLTLCFGALQAAGKEVEYVYLTPDSVFRNPTRHGSYLFDGVVTPFGADGSANQTSAYELRAYEPLPQVLTAVPTYDPRAKMLTVTGRYRLNDKSPATRYVHVYAATSDDAVDWIDLGIASTHSDGSYTFAKRFGTFRYRYVYATVDETDGPTCPGKSALPAGCAAISTDGVSSNGVKVVAQF